MNLWHAVPEALLGHIVAVGPDTDARIPRGGRLLALAHRLEKLIRDGVVADYPELAQLGHVSRARLPQIMDLLNLAPDIQEQILSLRVENGKERITERQVREVAAKLDWTKQRSLW